ncbi:DOM34-interacting protein [Paracoccidioides lutzii Pb01]|uniref:DOM34-interacting protein n=1 Tax=Paracoccidioides lutzii (strain ATCC MYA-826 / Pb01) TaxID=502779 RepID=C1H4G9_PARBA|nr:DOM34-interacting protein [Paracoccidioides lutzii Pb01]EEH34613.1 DOM34-interacting protein [Paracoccidioides lutzii Pb01]
MVKSYLKFEPSKTFGLIASASSNAVWTPDEYVSAETRQTGAGRAVVGAGEEVICWDVKKGELLSKWRDIDCSAQVTVISQSKTDQDIFAVGYEDGTIRIWDSRLATVMICFNGHKTAVTQLAFDGSGVRLASGSKDTDIIVWDLIAEVGIVKLRGHTDQITSINFLTGSSPVDGDGDSIIPGSNNQDRFLLSTGKDSLIKIWDLLSQHCIETHVAQSNGECWSLGLSPDQSGCITGGNDGELRVWSIDANAMDAVAKETGATDGRKVLVDRGNLYRQGKDRTIGIHFHPRLDYIAVHGAEKSIEIWRIRTEAEVQKSLVRKRKRRREKAGEQGGENELENGADVDKSDPISSAPISEVFVSHTIVRTGGKIRSVDWMGGKGLKLLAATTNNQLEVYRVTAAEKRKTKDSDETEYSRTFSVDMPGHRTDIRSLALSSDDRMLSSASNGSLKIWNVRTQTCLRTLECGYSLCSAFLPGDKIVVVGNKNGDLEMFDIASSTLLDTIQAHEGPIWALHVHPDGKSIVTGSADKTAKFWDFKVVQEEILGTKRTTPRLKLVHTRTLKVNDDILSIRFSPDARLIAVALLDNTVKVFFVDTLKLFLILYGHKLPVLNMDISYDSKLIVTCSADKNVRLWGLDFGDCHKAFFAHQDSIMAVAFIPNNNEGNGHHFFSASKDHVIKYWDGDKFEQIQKLGGHHGEIWSLAVSRSGEFIVSASHDKSIRIWEQTDEQIFLEEEREKELEELYDSTLATSLDRDDEVAEGEHKAEAVAAGKQTVTTLMAGEKIVEALDLGMEDIELLQEWNELKLTNPKAAPPPRNPVYLALGNISAERHVLRVIQKIPAAALQDALLVLPFSKLPSLFTFINIWAKNGWEIPLTCRVLFFMLKTHHRQIVASKMMRPMLDGIRGNLLRVLTKQKDEMGFNIAALKFISNQVRQRGRSDYVDEELWEKEEEREKGGSKKRYFVNVS